MNLILILTFLSAAIAVSSAGRVVCFFISWSIYRAGDGKFGATEVDPTLCTHLIYSYIGLDEEGAIVILDDWDITGLMEIDHLKNLKTLNPDLVLMVCMGGYSVGSEQFSPVAADPDLRATLIDNILTFMDTYEFDGFNLDWEYPGKMNGSDPINDPGNYVTLLSELYSALSAKNYIFSAGVSGITYYIKTSYVDVEAITDNVDFLNIKTMDYHGDWETVTGHYAPLYPIRDDPDSEDNISAAITLWLSLGADPAKINLGLGAYGRSFTLVDPDSHDVSAPVSGSGEVGPLTKEAGMLGYNEICDLIADYEHVWIDDQSVPYMYSNDQWVGYDDPRSIKAKVEYANEMELGGVSLYSLDTDDFLGNCGETFPLLKAINDNLN